MRNRYRLGVPAAAGLLTGGYALSQGEDPGSVGLATAAGALGAYGGLRGAKALAGKYSPQLSSRLQRQLGKVEDAASRASARMPDDSLRANVLMDISQGAGNIADKVTDRRVLEALGAGIAPTSALAAGLGGVALGAIPGAMGVPGFQQGGAIDPESPYVSQNPRGLGMTTMQYV